jgi:hypothetical protein
VGSFDNVLECPRCHVASMVLAPVAAGGTFDPVRRYDLRCGHRYSRLEALNDTGARANWTAVSTAAEYGDVSVRVGRYLPIDFSSPLARVGFVILNSKSDCRVVASDVRSKGFLLTVSVADGAKTRGNRSRSAIQRSE